MIRGRGRELGMARKDRERQAATDRLARHQAMWLPIIILIRVIIFSNQLPSALFPYKPNAHHPLNQEKPHLSRMRWNHLFVPSPPVRGAAA